MGRKRKNEDDKKTTFHLSIKKKIIDELKEKEEVPSRIIEELVEKYLNEKNKGEK